MTIAKRKSSTDDKVEAKRRIIRQSIDEINAEMEPSYEKPICGRRSTSWFRHAIHSSPSRVPVICRRDEWSRMSEIVRGIVGKRLGGNELRGRPLARSVARAATDATDTTAG